MATESFAETHRIRLLFFKRDDESPDAGGVYLVVVQQKDPLPRGPIGTDGSFLVWVKGPAAPYCSMTEEKGNQVIRIIEKMFIPGARWENVCGEHAVVAGLSGELSETPLSVPDVPLDHPV